MQIRSFAYDQRRMVINFNDRFNVLIFKVSYLSYFKAARLKRVSAATKVIQQEGCVLPTDLEILDDF